MKSHDFESLYRRASANCARRETCRGDLEKKFRAAEIEPDLIDRILKREINPGKVFTLRLPLEEAPEAYKAMDERRAIKVLLEP